MEKPALVSIFDFYSSNDNLCISHHADIDECLDEDVCEDLCTNTDGSFNCTCPRFPGYEPNGTLCTGKWISTCMKGCYSFTKKQKQPLMWFKFNYPQHKL